MRKFTFLIILGFITANSFAQANGDSLAYQLQRKKINSMLAQRTKKFGQYDESLTMHTGIFGLQTKKDIRRSNDILMDIVKTDDAIYKEIKVLLDFRTFQQTQVQSHAIETDENNIGFMNTINKLRAQVDRLKAEAEKSQQEQERLQHTFIFASILMLASILLLIIRKRKRVV